VIGADRRTTRVIKIDSHRAAGRYGWHPNRLTRGIKSHRIAVRFDSTSRGISAPRAAACLRRTSFPSFRPTSRSTGNFRRAVFNMRGESWESIRRSYAAPAGSWGCPSDSDRRRDGSAEPAAPSGRVSRGRIGVVIQEVSKSSPIVRLSRAAGAPSIPSKAAPPTRRVGQRHYISSSTASRYRASNECRVSSATPSPGFKANIELWAKA